MLCGVIWCFIGSVDQSVDDSVGTKFKRIKLALFVKVSYCYCSGKIIIGREPGFVKGDTLDFKKIKALPILIGTSTIL